MSNRGDKVQQKDDESGGGSERYSASNEAVKSAEKSSKTSNQLAQAKKENVSRANVDLRHMSAIKDKTSAETADKKSSSQQKQQQILPEQHTHPQTSVEKLEFMSSAGNVPSSSNFDGK